MPRRDEYDHLPIADALRKMADHHHAVARRHITGDERDLLYEAAYLLEQVASVRLAFSRQPEEVGPIPDSRAPSDLTSSGWATPRRRKEWLVRRIASLIDVEPPQMAPGSTVTKEIFLRVNESLDLGLDPDLPKPALARAIVEAVEMDWLPDYESEGGTVTRDGLEAVLHVVEFVVFET